jgi:hypothetical protein
MGVEDELRRLKLIAVGALDHPWRDTAVRFMEGWLNFVARQRMAYSGPVIPCTI